MRLRDLATEPPAFPRAEPLDERETRSVVKWAALDPAAPGLATPMSVARTLRNVSAHATSWGPRLIAQLVQAGALEPAGDPAQALENVLAAARRSGR
jgi:hypothetical protein